MINLSGLNRKKAAAAAHLDSLDGEGELLVVLLSAAGFSLDDFSPSPDLSAFFAPGRGAPEGERWSVE